MSWSDRAELYAKIEDHRKHPLIAYATSKRDGASARMASDALPYFIEQLDRLPSGTEDVDLLIASYGGDPMVAYRIMSLIHERVKRVSVLIPQSAYSAATLLAFGADKIIMHPNGHIGPVDMQIITQAKRFSTEDIPAFLDFVRDTLKITDQEHIRALFEITCKEVGSLGIGFTARSSRLAVDLAKRLLALHMTGEDDKAKIPSIVENMSRKFQSHGYPVNRNEAIEIGLPVNKTRDEQLENLMWQFWLSIESDFKERTPFNPLHEVLNSAEGTKLLAPVPQIDLPLVAPGVSQFGASLQEVIDHSTVKINPVDFEFDDAIVESRTIAHTRSVKGKILSCRTPDLVVQFSQITTFQGWKKEEKSK